jgi:hypothetical protein
MQLTRVKWLIQNRLNPRTLEDQVGEVWNTILNWMYPAAESFSVSPEQWSESRRADLVLTRIILSDTKLINNPFFVVECKASKHLSSDNIWAHAMEQLNDYVRD